MASKSGRGQYLYLEGSFYKFQTLIASLEPLYSPPPPKGPTYPLNRFSTSAPWKDPWTPVILLYRIYQGSLYNSRGFDSVDVISPN